MTANLTPDVAALVTRVLSESADVAAIVGERVTDRTPESLSDPWVRITQLDDTPYSRSPTLHLVAVHLQIDCYGGDDQPAIAHEDASLLFRTVRAVLHGLPGVHDEGTVSSVTFDNGPRIPDAEFTPPRERFILDATVWAHS